MLRKTDIITFCIAPKLKNYLNKLSALCNKKYTLFSVKDMTKWQTGDSVAHGANISVVIKTMIIHYQCISGFGKDVLINQRLTLSIMLV